MNTMTSPPPAIAAVSRNGIATTPQSDFSTAEMLCSVLSNQPVNSEYRHLVLQAPAIALTAKPGQFFHLACPAQGTDKPYLRRPMSVYRVDPSAGNVEFLYKVQGAGTRGLATLRKGNTLDIMGPVGQGFTLPPACRHLLILARAARAQAECFTEDGVWEGGVFGGDLSGREALYENFLHAPWRYAMHFYQAPDLQLDGDEATGSWLLWQIGVRHDDSRTLLLHGRTHEHYRRTPKGWLISRMRFDSLHSLFVADARDMQCLIPAQLSPQT